MWIFNFNMQHCVKFTRISVFYDHYCLVKGHKSTTLSLYGQIRVRKNLQSGIFYARNFKYSFVFAAENNIDFFCFETSKLMGSI